MYDLISQERLDKAAEEMRRETGGEILAIASDVRKPEEIIKVIDAAIEKFGKIDILVNGAAGNFLSPVETLSYRGFRTVIEIDLLGTYNTTRAAFPYLKESKGVVINVSANLHYQGMIKESSDAIFNQKIFTDMLQHFSPTYLRQKQVLAVEWGPHQIRVNCIAPGPIEDTVGISKLATQAHIAEGMRSIPLQRWRLTEKIDITKNTGNVVWDGAYILSKYIVDHVERRDQNQVRFLELGSGCGLVGLAAWIKGGHVVCSGTKTNIEHTRMNVEKNVELVLSQQQQRRMESQANVLETARRMRDTMMQLRKEDIGVHVLDW
ncbi:1507_t:CDS:2 [Acaulospora colombiana]|uniref:1507_t:CDS:1 n=1 Tax=Acaulospora colombiana TaxID=27376 RepID=A0ACA9K8B6_9GLOM|nr:1507_t:CDS:2 [Acaulospora colombiana]